MAIDLYRNNRAYISDICRPLSFIKSLKLPTDNYIMQMKLFDHYLTAWCKGYCICFDIESNNVVWETTGNAYILEIQSDIVLMREGGLFKCKNKLSGELIWEMGREDIWGLSENKLYCDEYQNDNELLTCKHKASGKTIWQREWNHSDLTSIVAEKNIVLGNLEEAVCRLDEDSGKTIWWLTLKDIMEDQDIDPSYYLKLRSGPLVNGIYYFGVKFSDDPGRNSGGYLIALDSKDGTCLWKYKLDDISFPADIIYSHHKVYFNIIQAWNPHNYITCLNAETGELIFKRDENNGDRFPVVTNNYLLTGYDNILEFIDLETDQCVYTYKHEKRVEIFKFGCATYENQLISYDCDNAELYFFQGGS